MVQKKVFRMLCLFIFGLKIKIILAPLVCPDSKVTVADFSGREMIYLMLLRERFLVVLRDELIMVPLAEGCNLVRVPNESCGESGCMLRDKRSLLWCYQFGGFKSQVEYDPNFKLYGIYDRTNLKVDAFTFAMLFLSQDKFVRIADALFFEVVDLWIQENNEEKHICGNL